MIKSIICIGVSLLWFANVFATTDVYVSVGTAEARYSELIGRQNADMTGTEQSLSIRNLNSIGSIDLGLDLGTLKLDGASKAHQVDFDGNYINFISGVSFSLYPNAGGNEAEADLCPGEIAGGGHWCLVFLSQ
jgi:hypothetical protein